MKKLTIKNVVEFRRKKSEGSRKTLVRNLKTADEKKSENQRNYWHRCESAIKNSFKTNDLRHISNKINELKDLLLVTTYGNTIKQYNHNINILRRFEHFDFSVLKPSEEIKFLKLHNENKILTINGLPIEAAPSFVFSFENNGNEEVGAIWFVSLKDGFRDEELGMFTDISHRYLEAHFSKDYDINSQFCIAVDLYNGTYLSFSQLELREVHRILNSTISKIKELM